MNEEDLNRLRCHIAQAIKMAEDEESGRPRNDFWSRLCRYIEDNHKEDLFEEPAQFMEESKYAYTKARTYLDPETEDDLVLYVAACEEYCRCYAQAAYEMGCLEGARAARQCVTDPSDNPPPQGVTR